MAKIILDMAMSLDGFIATKKGAYIYPISDIKKSKEFKLLVKKAGSVVMDMDAYNMAKGDFTNYEYQVPIFVLAEKVPAKVAKGENENLTFTFVANGILAAIKKAKKVAGNKNVMIIGLAKIAQESLKQGQIDEIIMRIMPVSLGKGVRLFENLGRKEVKLKVTKSKQLSNRNDIYFKVMK